MTTQIGLLAFPQLTQLDLTGPYEVLSHLPDTEICIVAQSTDPVRADGNFIVTPHRSFSQARHLDVLIVPGGPGINHILNDTATIDYVRDTGAGARYVTSVCTGALLLGAAGFLRGKRATTHWAAKEFLEAFGAIAVNERIVRDGRLITGGGVTAGIDFGLAIAAELAGWETAEAIQLMLEYDPQPPFNAGNPAAAGDKLVQRVRQSLAYRHEQRTMAVQEAAARLENAALTHSS